MRFGIVSDVHYNGSAAHTQAIEKAFNVFSASGVDAVMIAGDIADSGLNRELNAVGELWRKAFPNGRSRSGRPAEKLFVYGNHDVEAAGWEYIRAAFPKETADPAAIIVTDAAAAWTRAFDEPYAKVWYKRVCGIPIVGAHWGVKGSDVAAVLAAHSEELRKGPFFYVQHPHLRGAVGDPWVGWCMDDGSVSKVLSDWPNAIAICGHSHMSLTDEQMICQTSFTSVGASSLVRPGVRNGRENVGRKVPDRPIKQMPSFRATGAAVLQGLFVSVYADRVVFERRDLASGRSLGEDWVVPLGARASRPYNYTHRMRTMPIPQFAAGTAVSVSDFAPGKNRLGRETLQCAVTFPVLTSPVRAFDYEVILEERIFDFTRVVSTKRVFSSGIMLPPERDNKPVKCVFSIDEIPFQGFTRYSSEVRFVVRPINAFGRAGDSIATPWRKTTEKGWTKVMPSGGALR